MKVTITRVITEYNKMNLFVENIYLVSIIQSQFRSVLWLRNTQRYTVMSLNCD